jgi:Ice-binding-like
MKRLMLVIYIILSMGSLCWAQTAPSLGAAVSFSVLGNALTCTSTVITGDVGATGAFTNTGCIIAGGTPLTTNALAAEAALTSAFNAINPINPSNCNATETGNLAGVTLTPGVYCFSGAATLTGTLTLDGSGVPNPIWIFEVNGAVTGTAFQVVMVNGQACNVFWSVNGAVTLSSSTTVPLLFQGNILASGAITMTGGSLIGRALASGAVTLTSINIQGSCALLAQGQAQGQASCTDNDHEKDKDKDRDHEKDKDKGHEKEKEKNRDR